MRRALRVLAIETSCDDTCAAVLSGPRGVCLSACVWPQHAIHMTHRGVHPGAAARQHRLAAGRAIRLVLAEAATSKKDNMRLCADGIGRSDDAWIKYNAIDDSGDDSLPGISSVSGGEASMSVMSFHNNNRTPRRSPDVTVFHNDSKESLERDGGTAVHVGETQHARDTEWEAGLSSAVAAAGIDVVAVTVGPGLHGSLSAGLEAAQAVCRISGLPLMPINHLEGHALMARRADPNALPFPFVLLLVSGGHSQLMLCRGPGDFFQFGGTLDDSLGEAFDKAARALGLTFAEGGAGLERLAAAGDPLAFPELRTPLLQGRLARTMDFSFSGLKSQLVRVIDKLLRQRKDHGQVAVGRSPREHSTSVSARDAALALLNLPSYETNGNALPVRTRADLAASFQRAAFGLVERRLMQALAWCNDNPRIVGKQFDTQHVLPVVVSGGVARNSVLRSIVESVTHGSPSASRAIFPPLALCTDNAEMIGWAALERLYSEYASSSTQTGVNLKDAVAQNVLFTRTEDIAAVSVRPRYPLHNNEPGRMLEPQSGIVYPDDIERKRRGGTLRVFT